MYCFGFAMSDSTNNSRACKRPLDLEAEGEHVQSGGGGCPFGKKAGGAAGYVLEKRGLFCFVLIMVSQGEKGGVLFRLFGGMTFFIFSDFLYFLSCFFTFLLGHHPIPHAFSISVP